MVKLKVAVYRRVSTDEQAKKGLSLKTQRIRTKAFIKAKGWKLLEIYTDKGKSGRTTKKRSGYKQLMKDMDRWDVLLVYRLDRLHRNTKNLAGDLEKIVKNNKSIVSITEGLDSSTSSGRVVIKIMSAIAEGESEILGERVSHGKKTARKYGRWITRPPYGYMMARAFDEDVKQTTKKGKYLKVKKSEAKIVTRIYNLAEQGESIGQIARILNDEGIPSKGNRLKRKTARWTPLKVKRVLTNPIYMGFMRDEDNLVRCLTMIESIISPEIWLKLNPKDINQVIRLVDIIQEEE